MYVPITSTKKNCTTPPSTPIVRLMMFKPVPRKMFKRFVTMLERPSWTAFVA